MENLISVIVCTYNQEDSIGRTLDSILRQECHVPMEIIVGEDCSTDGTLGVCRRYAAQHPGVIRLMANRKNKGIVDNYFDCLLAARGKYIADCAGDDEWSDPLKLEKEVRLLEAHPEVTLVHTDYLVRDAADGTIAPPPPHPCCHAAQGETVVMEGEELLIPILTQLRRPVIHLCTALYRTEVIVEAYHRYTDLFRNKEYGCEDVQVCVMLARAGKVAYIDQPTLYYTMGGRSVSNTQDETRQFHFVKNTTQLDFDLAQLLGLGGEALQKYFECRIYALLMHAFRCHSKTLRTEALQCQTLWHTRLNRKAQMVKWVTALPLCWSFFLQLRKVFVTCKQTRP